MSSGWSSTFPTNRQMEARAEAQTTRRLGPRPPPIRRRTARNGPPRPRRAVAPRRLFEEAAAIIVNENASKLGKWKVNNFTLENIATFLVPNDPWVIVNENGLITQPQVYDRSTLNRLNKNPMNRKPIKKIARAPENVKKKIENQKNTKKSNN